MKPIKITLTIAQHRFFREEIDVGRNVGDCDLCGLTLTMEYYERAHATLRLFLSKRTRTTRDYITWNSVVNRLNAAIRYRVGSGVTR